ncbi:hypothetical protein [Streptomyces sp. NEAU-YJ-81]|uniref:hypothetical protein n=1 Tax=Streptomyces sp. NEAU-YJ-81 TaxID=2820288 RepID=UPI001ABD223B|nr:hypothetical protein [Streptomyces sp. NEAU-YJ-81]MBO3679503.1 hypothetical protein [Streptomyces sp. NEAU-YJ-81]
MRNHRLTLTLAATAAGLALFVTGCSGSSDSGGSKDSASSENSAASGGSGDSGGSGSDSDSAAFDKAQKLRTCLRDKGIDVPDLKPGEDPRSATLGQPEGVSADKWSKALEDCGSGMAGGGSGGAADQQGSLDQQVKIAECVRGKGFDMPDPKPGPDGGNTGFRIPKGADPDKFLKALNECAA